MLLALLLITGLVEAQASLPKAHEYIRVVQENGVWWFQDGSGRKFFSLGVNCVGGCYGHAEETQIIPSRKKRIVSLLKDWGFNTAACWSSPSVWDDMYVSDRIYTAFVPNKHDGFDDSFWNGWFADHLKSEVKPFLGKKKFIGYFLDNEPWWNAEEIFEFYLSLGKNKPGSRAFVTFLKKYYQESVRKLNQEWGTSRASFDKIPGTRPPKQYSFPMKQGILNAWRIEVVAAYYRRCSAMVRALDPDHLILGIRYAGVPDLELFKALSPYFDVNSINDYNRYGDLKPVYAELYRATGKPLMITEFSFSGFPYPDYKSLLFIDVYTQENRGVGYHKYVLQAARAPFMVGMQWFMWMDYAKQDEAKGGYPYPPDENVGLVSNDEKVVYEGFGRWVKRTNTEAEATHRVARWVPRPEQGLQHRALKRFVPTVDGDTSEWPKELAIKPAVVNSLLDNVRADHTYFISWDKKHLYLAGDISDSHLEHPHRDWAWEGDYLSIDLSPVKPPDTCSDCSSSIFIYPIGGGSDKQQPYAARWEGPKRHQLIPLQVAKRLKPGGYTIEVRIPSTAVMGFKGVPGVSWKIQLRYQNVNEIYQTNWEGVVTLRP